MEAQFLPCDPTPDCKYYDRGDCPIDSTHHLYWPKGDYESELEKKFREHPTNKMQICRDAHDKLHATEAPPRKPGAQEIVSFILKNS